MHKQKINSKLKRKIPLGRPKNSFSFVAISLTRLRAHAGSAAMVLVSRKWAENVGIRRARSGPANLLTRA